MRAGTSIVLATSLFLGACGGTVNGDGDRGAAGAGGAGGAAGQGVGGVVVAGAPNAGGAPVTPRQPVKHRAAATPCPSPPLAGPSLPCASDAECTAGPKGRCMPPGGQGTCVYSYCTTDAECEPNQVCECSPDGYANRCVGATGCALDSDCPGSWCSPTFGTCGGYSGVVAYECHTPRDRCVDDTDCAAGGGYCMFEPTVGYWQCGYGQCVG